MSILSFNVAAPPRVDPLSLHDALPISRRSRAAANAPGGSGDATTMPFARCHRAGRVHYAERGESRPDQYPFLLIHGAGASSARSEEHTSELQSRRDLVCRLPPEKKNPN